MKRQLLLIALAASSLALPAESTSAGPVDHQAFAFADWSGKRIDRNHWEWYGAVVIQRTSVRDGTRISGGVFKGVCGTVRRAEGVFVSCGGRGSGLSDKDRFSIDPTASTAELEQRDRDGRHHVEWIARKDTDPQPFLSESYCSDGPGRGGGLVRQAESKGRVYGRRFRSQREDRWNELWVGAHVTPCGLLSARELADLMDGGTFAFNLTRPI